jgi:ribosomal protein L11 methylase PrmA
MTLMLHDWQRRTSLKLDPGMAFGQELGQAATGPLIGGQP